MKKTKKDATPHGSPAYTIIGNSAAAIGAVEGIRAIDAEGPITIFTDEPYPAYSRPMITDYLTDPGILENGRMFIRHPEFYSKNKVELVTARVTAVDIRKKYLTAGGSDVSFKKLLIASGGRPVVPEIAGLRDGSGRLKKGVFTLTSLGDAVELERAAKKSKNVVILGGGLIGLKAAHALRDLGLSVTVVELCDCCLAPVLDKTAWELVRAEYERNGVVFRNECTIKEVTGKTAVSGVRLSDGKKHPADILLVAIGVSPRIDFLKDSGLKIERGIKTDRQQRASADSVWAAGDCAESFDFVLGKERLLPLWPNAYYGGLMAGRSMAGKGEPYEWATNMNSFEAYGLSAVSAGRINPVEKKFVTLVSSAGRQGSAPPVYRKVVLDGGIVSGMIFVNDIESAGLVLSLARRRADVSAFVGKLTGGALSLTDLPEGLRKDIYENS